MLFAFFAMEMAAYVNTDYATDTNAGIDDKHNGTIDHAAMPPYYATIDVFDAIAAAATPDFRFHFRFSALYFRHAGLPML